MFCWPYSFFKDTGKKHSQIKLHQTRKVWIWKFGWLVLKINSSKKKGIYSSSFWHKSKPHFTYIYYFRNFFFNNFCFIKVIYIKWKWRSLRNPNIYCNLFAIYHNLLHSIYIIYDSYCNNTLFKNNSNYVKQHILFV